MGQKLVAVGGGMMDDSPQAFVCEMGEGRGGGWKQLGVVRFFSFFKCDVGLIWI